MQVRQRNAGASRQLSRPNHATRRSESRRNAYAIARILVRRVSVAIVSCVALLPAEWNVACGQVIPPEASQQSAPARFVVFQRATHSEFDLRKVTIPRKRILGGGPSKDGILALSSPKLIGAGDADYLAAGDRVIGVEIDGEARAYPLRILEHHEIVNDRIGDLPIAVTYCPLCDSAAVFDRRTEIGEREFGVSGLLYNSNVLMYDRGGSPESLWSQVMAEGVSGPGGRKRLRALPVELTTWSAWIARHPQTKVLSPNTGHARDYRRSPYASYFSTQRLWFDVRPRSRRLTNKEPVLGVWTAGAAKAYTLSAFEDRSETVRDELDGQQVTVKYDPGAKSLRVVEADDGVQWMYALWFAWYAFHPQTEVYRPLLP